MKIFTKYLPHTLLGVYLVLFTLLGINSYERSAWFVENLPILIVVFGLLITFRKFRFSNISYILIFLFLCYQTIGGYYTFQRVPFDVISNLFGWEHNNFDRIGHFLVGVFTYPIAELFMKRKWAKNIGLAVFAGIMTIGFWAALCEVIEMIYVVQVGGNSSINFLGSQSDVWDAQKDIGLDILGAGLFGWLFVLVHKKYEKK